jgi:hypothetical protein
MTERGNLLRKRFSLMSNLSPDYHYPTPVRKNWIDTVRATACLMVILLHVAAYYTLIMRMLAVQTGPGRTLSTQLPVPVCLYSS